LIGRKPVNLIVGWGGQFYFCCPLQIFTRQFSQAFGWSQQREKIDESQQKIKIVRTNRQSNLRVGMEIGPIRNQNLIF